MGGWQPLDGLLETAIAIALRVHDGQRDKAGAAYILHPLRVMMRMPTLETRLAAVLHDTIEDSRDSADPVTADSLLAAGIPRAVVEAVVLLTRESADAPAALSYDAYVGRICGHPLARQVKLADVEDNLDLTRLTAPLSSKDEARVAKYVGVRLRLLQAVGGRSDPSPADGAPGR